MTPDAARPTQPNTASYAARHWRGDLSLPVSYWVNNVLITTALVFVLYLIGAAFETSDNPRPVAWIIVAWYVLALIVTPWQLVGAWRSADKHTEHGGQKKWATLAKVVIFLGAIQFPVLVVNKIGPQMGAYWKMAAGTDEYADFSVRILRDASELELSGGIGLGVTRDIRNALDNHPTVRLIHLNSVGGRVGEARRLRDLIQERGLSTYVATHCLSACVIAFVAGNERLVAKDAKLGFHQYSFPGADSSDFAAEYAKDKAYFLQRGITKSFIDTAYATPSNDLWRPTHAELFAAKVITRYSTSDDVALSGVAVRSAADVEHQLLEIPIYRVLKNYEPEIYARLLGAITAAFQKGHSMGELRMLGRPLLEEAFMKHLPRTSESAISQFVRVMLEQMEYLYSVDPVSCYELLFPQSTRKGRAVADLLSKDLVSRELAVISKVISDSASSPQPVPTEAQVRRQLEEIQTFLVQRFGNDAAVLDKQGPSRREKGQVCEISYALYSHILTMPTHERAPLLRFMFAGR